MNRLLIALQAVLVTSILISCSATMVHSPGDSSQSQNAPINERSRGGVVKYLNAGADSVINARRESAYKQMYESCHGRYRIDAEGPREEGGVVMPIGTGAYFGNFQYWYIQFSCVE